MRNRLSLQERVWCYQQHQAERTYPDVAQEIGRSPECVRYWCRKLSKGGLAQTSLQVVLDQAVYELVLELPSHAKDCHGQPPIQVHPELLEPGRWFRPEWEQACFDLKKVNAYLATRSWTRMVSKVGVVELGGQRYSLGRQYTRREILIHFDPADRHFVFFAPEDPEEELRRCAAKGLETEQFLDIQLPLPAQQLAFPWFTSSPSGNL